MCTKTRDTSEYGFHYLSGLLRMETKRNMANIGRKTGVSGQNMQHFMSNSPWPARELINALQQTISYHEAMAEAVLVIDESADEKAGEHSAGHWVCSMGFGQNRELSEISTLKDQFDCGEKAHESRFVQTPMPSMLHG